MVELGREIGWFEVEGKAGSKSKVCFFEAACVQQLDTWAEGTRQRQWMTWSDAKQVSKHEYMLRVLEQL